MGVIVEAHLDSFRDKRRDRTEDSTSSHLRNLNFANRPKTEPLSTNVEGRASVVSLRCKGGSQYRVQ